MSGADNKKVILITGARKGIGLSLCEHFLRLGHQVIGCSRKTSELSNKAYRHFCVDIRDEGSVVKMFSDIQSEFGGVGILINNAGIASMNHSLLTPTSTVQDIFATNVFGLFSVSREAAKQMKVLGKGRIINFSTIAVPFNLEGEAIYAASKSSVETLTKILAKEFASWGITVNAVGPTPIETDLIAKVPKQKIDEILKRQAIKRFGSFEDVANIIDFFISDKSDFVSGQIIYLGGV